MFDKLASRRNFSKAKQLSDPRNLGLIAFVIVVLLITWSGFKAVQNNYKLEKQISVLQQQDEVQRLKNQNLKLQNDYYNSNQYLELSARQNFGLAAPGETELIVPRNVAMSYVKNIPNPADSSSHKPTSKSPFFVRNLKAWWNFFLGRQTSGN